MNGKSLVYGWIVSSVIWICSAYGQYNLEKMHVYMYIHIYNLMGHYKVSWPLEKVQPKSWIIVSSQSTPFFLNSHLLFPFFLSLLCLTPLPCVSLLLANSATSFNAKDLCLEISMSMGQRFHNAFRISMCSIERTVK